MVFAQKHSWSIPNTSYSVLWYLNKSAIQYYSLFYETSMHFCVMFNIRRLMLLALLLWVGHKMAWSGSSACFLSHPRWHMTMAYDIGDRNRKAPVTIPHLSVDFTLFCASVHTWLLKIHMLTRSTSFVRLELFSIRIVNKCLFFIALEL